MPDPQLNPLPLWAGSPDCFCCLGLDEFEPPTSNVWLVARPPRARTATKQKLVSGNRLFTCSPRYSKNLRGRHKQPPAQEVLRFFSDATCLSRFAFVEIPGKRVTVTTNRRKPLDPVPESNDG